MKVFVFNHKASKLVSLSIFAKDEAAARAEFGPFVIDLQDWTCEMMMSLPRFLGEACGCGNPYCSDPNCQKKEHKE